MSAEYQGQDPLELAKQAERDLIRGSEGGAQDRR